MIDIKIFRENPEIIRESEKKRFNDVLRVDKVIKFDEQWRKLLQQVNDLRKERNTISRQIGPLKKKGEDITSLMKRVNKIKTEIIRIEKKSKKVLEERDSLRYVIGNILLPGVPIAENEEGDVTIRTWGDKIKFKFPIKSHTDLVESLDLAELGKAAEVSGSRTFYLKNDLVLLNLALIQYAIQVLSEKGFIPFWTPPFLRRDVMERASELSDFEEQLYHDKNEDVFFIATSEQTLAALHMNELLDVDTLPRKYCGLSQCYRREAGSHGKDTKGIFRVHHFMKVEQFVFAHPESSEEMQEEMIKNAEDLFQGLKLPYRIVNIASGELNANAAKKYDLEAWFPAQNAYRELVSCSNVTDYQARKLNVTTGKAGGEKAFVHTLNSTAIAMERTICALLENYQQEDGSVVIPEVLRPYMHGKSIIALVE
ncbi:serine--tRNA ligase [Candidatus Heimdallarchaeota archaeon B3_Heim]|nr:MAG: serine--tRNA ligase [Candidatus Heimdallarchaeota archaeon B3_Heim]